MQLPELPRQLNKREADATPYVLKWLENNWPNSAGVEIKIEDGPLKGHQNRALKRVKRGRFSYKIRDLGQRNPLDAVLLINADALIVRVYGGHNCVIEHNGHTINFTI